ncbi:hypothetical protein C5167_046299 [Papaver somniferum]|uniref:Uncharacterized protein n=1 Tax=Papaver somniferum TaxID=3469 RepID=A0A4Y7LDE3_PAPSO|nr:hypothetical protein C5167_046299 [Papaver somniferum]
MASFSNLQMLIMDAFTSQLTFFVTERAGEGSYTAGRWVAASRSRGLDRKYHSIVLASLHNMSYKKHWKLALRSRVSLDTCISMAGCTPC